MKKILLSQLGSNGDCLLTTPLAKQIKEVDYPGCHLTWLVGNEYKQVLLNNPYIDEFIEIPDLGSPVNLEQARLNTTEFIENLVNNGKYFDKIFILDINKYNREKYYNTTTRAVYFNIYEKEYNHKIKVSPEPIINLTNEEVKNVKNFVQRHELNKADIYPVLFECSPLSYQSSINIEKSFYLAAQLINKYYNVKIILSSKHKIPDINPRIIDGSELTYRENVELLNNCKLLIGCSSGITWLNSSNYSRKIPTIQVIKEDKKFNPNGASASLIKDYKNLNLPTEEIIEFRDFSYDILLDCFDITINKNIKAAKFKYNGISLL